MINPQRCVGFFTVTMAVYDGDTFSTVVDRVRRTSGVPGEFRFIVVMETPSIALSFSMSF